MVMIATDELTDGRLIDLPPEAGDLGAPHFEPDDAWLTRAEPAAQKTAMWRWFATRFEELESSTPHDAEGEYFFGQKDPPVVVDDELRRRFSGVVDAAVVDALIADVRAKAGILWARVEFDKMSS